MMLSQVWSGFTTLVCVCGGSLGWLFCGLVWLDIHLCISEWNHGILIRIRWVHLQWCCHCSGQLQQNPFCAPPFQDVCPSAYSFLTAAPLKRRVSYEASMRWHHTRNSAEEMPWRLSAARFNFGMQGCFSGQVMASSNEVTLYCWSNMPK